MSEEAVKRGVEMKQREDGSMRELPTPKRTMRTLTLAAMALTTLVSGYLALSLWGDAAYALSPAVAMEVGAYQTATLDGSHDNRYVRASVSLDGSKAIRFRRPFDGDSYRIAPSGQGRWVAYRVPASLAGPRFVPPQLVAGRLVRASELGPRFRGLAARLGPDSWVLVDGHDPKGAGWLLGLELLLLAFFGWNGWSIFKILRPAK